MAWITKYPCTTLTGSLDQYPHYLSIPKQGTKISNIMKCVENLWLLSIIFQTLIMKIKVESSRSKWFIDLSVDYNTWLIHGRHHSVVSYDIIKWKHFRHYWPFVWGIHWSLVNSPHKSHWHRALMFSLICAWVNSWVSNRDTGDLRCHHAHYNVTVMFNPHDTSCHSTFLSCH